MYALFGRSAGRICTILFGGDRGIYHFGDQNRRSLRATASNDMKDNNAMDIKYIEKYILPDKTSPFDPLILRGGGGGGGGGGSKVRKFGNVFTR